MLVNNYDEINARMEEGTVIQNSKEIRPSICQMLPEYQIEPDIKSFQSYNLDQKLHEVQFGNRL